MNKTTDWFYLSYPLSSQLSGYGNGIRIDIRQLISMAKGETSNNTSFCMPSHFGTHIDFPRHFSDEGKTMDDYPAKFFVFDNVSVINLETISQIQDFLIKPEHLFKSIEHCAEQTDFIFLKTGFCEKRNSDEYWEYGYGVGLGVAKLLKETFPNIRAIGLDLISLNSFQQRSIGRVAHKEFLEEHNILIVEDLDLRPITIKKQIEQLIVSPLNIRGAEGVPVTVFAKMLQND